MEKFLEIVYTNQLADSEKGDLYEVFFEPMMKRLRELLSDKLYEELLDTFTTCSVECNKYYAVEGMKLAIGIMDGSYMPTM